ncbi:CopG family ribbon-helix-helix protein [Acidithiobacillus sulfuriphilus]|uniref:Ribbon-helix-helix protein, CopG family n=2 Tax=Acidithiobacillus sulfuriphilus TaxID=1867749 RepID=A0A3M8SD74_9PROT|nr:ribbon-helix-helix protein, CopG family [Acidithiobacillus sulfuriphilus]RNF76760.1 ribbon-helix-helix protein, CopG family [Acidithiobacillus sulfuriphilus]
MATTTVPVAVKLDADLKERIKHLAGVKRRSSSWLMREAVREYVEREERLEQFRQAGREAWESFQTTGLHLTFAEADAWLGKLESGDDTEIPDCHV